MMLSRDDGGTPEKFSHGITGAILRFGQAKLTGLNVSTHKVGGPEKDCPRTCPQQSSKP